MEGRELLSRYPDPRPDSPTKSEGLKAGDFRFRPS